MLVLPSCFTWFDLDGNARDGCFRGRSRRVQTRLEGRRVPTDVEAGPAHATDVTTTSCAALGKLCAFVLLLLVVFLPLVHVLRGWFPPTLPSRALLETAVELAAAATAAAVLTLCRRHKQEWRMRLAAD